MKTSNTGINLIKQFEGLRLKSYKCPAGVWTIGYGTTRGVQEGMQITETQAEELLKKDLERFEANVMKYDSIYHWNQNEFDAMVSFAYNLGSIDGLTNRGNRDRKTISHKMLLYNKANGKVLTGLTKRRQLEQALFNKAVSGVQPGTTSFYPRYVGLSDSIVEALKSMNIDSSMQNRKNIALINGIVTATSQYKGSADQNIKMLVLLKQGNLKQP